MAARLRSRARKHYNMRSVLRGIFGMRTMYCVWAAPWVTVVPYKQFAHTCTVYVGLAQARPNYVALQL